MWTESKNFTWRYYLCDYVFVTIRQRISDGSSQKNEQNFVLNIKWKTSLQQNISKKLAVKEHVKCKDHIEAEKLETTHIQIEYWIIDVSII